MLLQRGPVFADGDRLIWKLVRYVHHWLQRGPVFADGDRRHPLTRGVPVEEASTGPRLRRRGSAPRDAGPSSALRCFNGAPSSQTGIELARYAVMMAQK